MRYMALVLAISTSCSSICDVKTVDLPVAALENAASEDTAFINAMMPKEWWRIFEDNQLTSFIETAFCQNPSIEQAEQRIDLAIAIAENRQSSFFPYIYFGADVSRQKLSKTGVIPFSTGPSGTDTPVIDVPAISGQNLIPAYFTLYETELNLSYEFDFWKKNRNAFAAACGRVQAKIADYYFSKLALGIAVAKTYFALQTDLARLANAKQLMENRQAYVDLIKSRIEANIDTDLSLQSAEFYLSDSKDLALQLEGSMLVHKYQLQALIAGDFQEEIFVASSLLPQVPLPRNLPLHLLSGRADIISKLWQIQSYGYEVEIAKAGFYPDFNLAAFFGFQTIHLPELLKWPSTFFNVDPAVTLPIFDGGRLMANLDSSKINYNIAILEYNRLVIDAAKEVLEGIAVLKNSWQHFFEMRKKADLQKHYNELISLKAAHSLASGLDELTSQGNWYLSYDQKLEAEGRTLQAMIELIQALGGGYENECEQY